MNKTMMMIRLITREEISKAKNKLEIDIANNKSANINSPAVIRGLVKASEEKAYRKFIFGKQLVSSVNLQYSSERCYASALILERWQDLISDNELKRSKIHSTQLDLIASWILMGKEIGASKKKIGSLNLEKTERKIRRESVDIESGNITALLVAGDYQYQKQRSKRVKLGDIERLDRDKHLWDELDRLTVLIQDYWHNDATRVTGSAYRAISRAKGQIRRQIEDNNKIDHNEGKSGTPAFTMPNLPLSDWRVISYFVSKVDWGKYKAGSNIKGSWGRFNDDVWGYIEDIKIKVYKLYMGGKLSIDEYSLLTSMQVISLADYAAIKYGVDLGYYKGADKRRDEYGIYNGKCNKIAKRNDLCGNKAQEEADKALGIVKKYEEACKKVASHFADELENF